MGRGGHGAESADDILYGAGVKSRTAAYEEAVSDRLAKRAADAVLYNSSGDAPDTDLVDTLANLRHWAERYDIPFELALEGAQGYYEADLEESPRACRVDPYECIGSHGSTRPDDESKMNEERADHAQQAVDRLADPGEREVQLQDTLASLMHFADRYGLDWQEMVERSWRTYQGDIEDSPPVSYRT